MSVHPIDEDLEPSRLATSISSSHSKNQLRVNPSTLSILCCFVLGAGLEVPYNSFITAFDYFKLTYPGRNVEFVLTLAFDPTALAAFILGFFLAHFVSLDVRVLGSLAIELLSVVLVVVMPSIGSNEEGFWVIVCLMGVVGIATALLHLAIFGLIATKGPVCCNAMMAGVGSAGLIMSLLRVITKSVFPNNFEGVQGSTILFFSLAGAWIVACMACYKHLRTPPAKIGVEEGVEKVEDPAAVEESASESGERTVEKDSGRGRESVEAERVVRRSGEIGGQHGSSSSVCEELCRVTRKMSYHTWVVFVCFAFTYIAFPGMISIIPSNDDNLNTTEWFPVILVALYNLFNFLSSWAPQGCLAFKPTQSGRLLILSLARVIFPVIFGVFAFGPVVVPDAFLYALVIVFGLTQGYLSSVAVILGPQLSEGDEQLAGEVLSFALNIGIMVGSVIAFLLSLATGKGGGH